MNVSSENRSENRVYRLDRFVVPAAAREEFLKRVNQTHNLLRVQRGFIQDFLIEKPGDDGTTVIATMVEWDSRETVERVVPIVKAAHRQMGFDPRETVARLGIAAEFGMYEPVRERTPAPA